jgi:hypothetical protein
MGPKLPGTAERFVVQLFQVVLRRAGSASEIEFFTARLKAGQDPITIFDDFTSCEEYRRLIQSPVELSFPPGHAYSPIVDPGALNERIHAVLTTREDALSDIDLDLAGQKSPLAELARSFRKIGFTAQPSPGRRYHYENRFFSYGDAIVLFAMIDRLRPRRIVEIGAGFSSACILDTIDDCGLDGVCYTVIDPEIERVTALLTPADRSRVEIIGRRVQDVPLAIFETFRAGDILFIDSSHVAKTGSDVLFEIFEILPRLPAGVMIHFHDCPYPFEYTANWVLTENRSWNELYFLRAFLMHNRAFRIRFFNDLIFNRERELVGQIMPDILKNTGASLWIEKLSPRLGDSGAGDSGR